METTTQPEGSGNWIVFVFGAVFNLLANIDLTFLLDYTLQAVVGGLICVFLKIAGDIFRPLLKEYEDSIRDFLKKKLKGTKKEHHED